MLKKGLSYVFYKALFWLNWTDLEGFQGQTGQLMTADDFFKNSSI